MMAMVAPRWTHPSREPVRPHALMAVAAAIMLSVAGCDWQAEWLYRSGLQAMERGEYPKARASFLRLSQDYPDHRYAAEAMLHRARILWIQEGQKEAAQVAYLDLLRDYPEAPETQTAMRELLEIYLDAPDQAIRAIQTAEQFVSRYPRSEHYDWAIGVLADLYVKTGQFEQAIHELSQAHGGARDAVVRGRIAVKLLEVQFLANDADAVIRTAPAVVDELPQQLDAERVRALYTLALAHEIRQNFESAIALLEQLESMHPNPKAVRAKIKALEERMARRKL